mmetsp:Transcript_26863/g.48444  ORF Transcript_26863/g.48444 Transcript_26863/m.48444 type:complete len:646 (+) Transcript_26863:90-2027(+)
MTASLPRVLILLAIVAAGCIISSLFVVSTKTTSPHNDSSSLRPRYGAAATSSSNGRHLMIQLDSFNDPKTIQLRPDVNNYAQTDGVHVTIKDIDKLSSGISVSEIVVPPAPAVDFNLDTQIIPLPLAVDDPHVEDTMSLNNEDNNVNVINNDDGNNNDVDTTTIANTIIAPYNIDNALLTVQAFRYTLFFFVYDSQSDSFVIIHNVPGCDYGCARIYRVAAAVAYALRKNFPTHFQGAEKGSEDFVVMMSTGDAPRIKRECLSPESKYCGSKRFAPILQFGSIFVNTEYLPSMVAMPLPVRPHMPCFDEWQVTDGHVCQDLQPKVDLGDTSIKSGMVFGAAHTAEYWDNLIPQIIWRGTDFQFLHTVFPGLRAPEFKLDIEPKQQSFPKDGSPDDDKRWAINTLWEMGDEQLLPRWRGVLLTSEAELEAREYTELNGGEPPKLPWVNIKFASNNVNGIKVPASENEEYQLLHKLGIMAIGEHVNMNEQARYRYHIDLGGGGGTTWTGTIEKLALPGLLFHHMTPTKDWFHDLLVPWEHYVPVEMDLSDLRNKFEWAESHPVEAKQIAEQGTQFARWMGSVEGFGRMYEEHMVAPLRNVLQAYRPMPARYDGKSVLDVINERGGQAGFTVVGRCSGLHSNSCESLV